MDLLIKVGDKVIWQSEDWEIYSIEEHIVELRRIEDGFGIGTKVDLRVLESGCYKQLYEQQKLRADELEHKLKKEIEESERQLRRWYEELKRADELEKQVETYKEYAENVIVKHEGHKALKKRADELENNINELKQDLQEWIDYAEYLADQHSVYDYQRVLDRLNDL